MFKSIQYKLVTIFGLLVISIITVIGSLLLVNIINFYNSEFTVMMEQVFTDDFINTLETTAHSDKGFSGMSETVRSYIGPLGIDTYRFYSILDSSGDVLTSSDPSQSKNLAKTDNIILAMSGKRGNMTNSHNSYMDYAVPISAADGSCEYIIYVRDSKEEILSITRSMVLIILQALLIGAVITIIIGYLLSRTITTPIINLTKRAERVASGEFDNMPPSDANDEIGRLSNTFRYMSSSLHKLIDEVDSEKTKVETILQNMTDGILAFNLKGELIHINPEAEKMLGITSTQACDFNELFSSLGADISFGELLYIRHDSPTERQIKIDDRYIRVNFVAFYIEQKASGILVVMHDITKQEKLENSRREFVANVSHELRTPLTTVKSYAETLIEMSDGEVQSKFLTTIVKETDRMTRIVKDLLTLSRLDEDTDAAPHKEEIDLDMFVGDIADRLKITAEKKNQTLTYKALSKLPPVFTDKDKLEQVIVNIISNAVKYTAVGGKIEVFTGRVYNDLYIKVVDNGIGIPKENLPRIFERFYRVDKARSRGTGGTGLGLAIAKQIMDTLGGRITIRSEYGIGTEVIISLPA